MCGARTERTCTRQRKRGKSMAILETKNLTYTYGVGTPFEKTAVENVNRSVEKGAFVGVIGHTGSG